MDRPFIRCSHQLLTVLLLASAAARAQSPAADPHHGIESFNRAFADATRHMDNDATLTLWADDGVSLLPSSKPIVGKPAIAAFIESVTKSLTAARMRRFDMTCHDIHVSGDWASEWCTEHQVVHLSDEKPDFDGHGKMTLILHRGTDGKWRIVQELWNQGTAADESGSTD